MGDLPDGDHGAQDDDAVNKGLEEVAIGFFGLHEHGVGRFHFAGRVVCFHKDLFGYAPPLCNARATG
jgi:hypothetical protein